MSRIAESQGTPIRAIECVPIVLGLIPQLTSRWETALYESLSPPTLYGLMSCAVSYAMERLLCEDVRALKRVADVSESLLVQGDEEVREAVVIGFLEGLAVAARTKH